MLSWGRKILDELELSGDGVSAGDSTAGVAGKAYGHGELNGLEDSHIQVWCIATIAYAIGGTTLIDLIGLFQLLKFIY